MKKIILSDHKLNLLVDEVTSRLLSDRPLRAGVITGNEIVDYCAHKQVGQFMLFRIYQDATQFVGQLNHPSFDFGSTEVKEDLRRFLSTLSRNILLREADFETRLRQAVYNTLKLILNPEDSISNFFFGNSESIPIEHYRKYAPYFSDYDFVIRAILAWNEKNQLSKVERDVFLEKFERVVELFEKKDGKSLGEYQRGLFLDLTGQEMDKVVANQPSQVIRTESAAAPMEFPKAEEKKSSEPAKLAPSKEDGPKKPLISIRPKSLEPTPPVQPVQEPFVPFEEKRTIPPWVETPAPAPQKEQPANTVFSVNSSAPRSETPPWVEKKTERKAEGIVLDPIVPLDEPEEVIPQVDSPKVEAPKVIETPKFEVETPRFEPKTVETPLVEAPITLPGVESLPVAEAQERKSVANAFENKDEKRSLNDRFSNRENGQPNILSANSGSPENQASTVLDRFKQKEEPKIVQPETPSIIEPLVQTPLVVPPKVEMEATVQETPAVVPPTVEQAASPKTVNTAGNEQRTLGDRFKEQTSGSVAENISGKNIRTEHIPVHKQFQFVQKVFGGSSVKFKVILDKINKTQSLAEADEVLEKYVFNDPGVNRNDKVAKEFEQLVRGRFE